MKRFENIKKNPFYHLIEESDYFDSFYHKWQFAREAVKRPKKPVQPKLYSTQPTAEQIAQYTTKVEAYPKELELYEAMVSAYSATTVYLQEILEYAQVFFSNLYGEDENVQNAVMKCTAQLSSEHEIDTADFPDLYNTLFDMVKELQK